MGILYIFLCRMITTHLTSDLPANASFSLTRFGPNLAKINRYHVLFSDAEVVANVLKIGGRRLDVENRMVCIWQSDKNTNKIRIV